MSHVMDSSVCSSSKIGRRCTSPTATHVSAFDRIRRRGAISTFLLSLFFLLAAYPQSLVAQAESDPQGPSGSPYMQQTPEALQQLVAPIALYPDSLVAQILAASTLPEQVLEADQWLQSHPNLQGDVLAQAVDQRSWDPSIKALAAFPSILGNMDKNLSWTSSLGDAYYNQEQGVIDAIQLMRHRAQQTGNLTSTPQQTVTTDDSDIDIEPASPDTVYVPAYDPWVVYGGTIDAWPGWYAYPGIWYDGPALFFGEGFGIGFYQGFGWGWRQWDFDWRHRYAVFGHERYYSQSRTFYNRDRFYRAEGADRVPNHTERKPEPFGGDHAAARGFDAPRGESGPRSFSDDHEASPRSAKPRDQSNIRSSAFSGFGSGGEERSFSSRGMTSFGGGGGFHGGGGRR